MRRINLGLAWILQSLGVGVLLLGGVCGAYAQFSYGADPCPGHAKCNVSCRGRTVGECSDSIQRCNKATDCNCGCSDDTSVTPAVCSCQ